MTLLRPEHVGIHVHAGPGAWVDPSVPVGCFRWHDWDGRCRWHEVETAPGIYDFADLDWLAATCERLGARMLPVFLGTPEFYATSKSLDAYGRVGGASMPDSMDPWARYVQACLRRYAPLIRICQVWNEPTGFFEPCMDGADGWGQLVELHQVAKIAARAVDPSIILASSGMLTGNPKHLDLFLGAIDSRGRRGATSIGALAMHEYGHTMAQSVVAHRRTRARLAAWGLPANFPIVMTECGSQPIHEPIFDRLTEAEQAADWVARVNWWAQHNVIGAFWYDWDGYRNEPTGQGYSMGRRPEFAAALTELRAQVA